MLISTLGYIFAGLTGGLVVFLFVYLIKKEKKLKRQKKLPIWIYIVATLALLFGIAAIALLVAAAAMKQLG